MRLKLINDPMNGNRYQWRLYDWNTNTWSDYHDAFDTYDEAIDYDLEQVCTFHVRFAARQAGALGHGSNYRRTIKGTTAKQAILTLYDDLEHISRITWE